MVTALEAGLKTLLLTVPLGPQPTRYPPVGALSILRYLARQDVGEVEFYHLDFLRPSIDQAVDNIVSRRPDVIGVSAVVSTSYAYTRTLVTELKRRLPETMVVIGGNMAASAEVLLRHLGADIVVTDEGEIVFTNILKRARTTRVPADFSDIPGLVLLNREGKLVNTGYERPLDLEHIYDIDWDYLVSIPGALDRYFPTVWESEHIARFRHDPRAFAPHRAGKRLVTLRGAKGCVARCTFCHRFGKGIRHIPVPYIIKRLEEAITRFNIGFLSFGDENFGTDRRWLTELCAALKPYDILWTVGGMRVNCISPDLIDMMKDAGCSGILYGMETGSPRILEVMEKKTKNTDNINAMRWTVERELSTVVQLIVGMPGETPDTVHETIAFANEAMTFSPNQNPNDISINFAQALPGTPLYEYGRHRGIIDPSLEGEEAYLMRVSDLDAHSEMNALNFTDYPYVEWQSWVPRINIEVNYAYVRKYGLAHYRSILRRDMAPVAGGRPDEARYFANPKKALETRGIGSDDDVSGLATDDQTPSALKLILQGKFGLAIMFHPVHAYRARGLLPLMVVVRAARRGGLKYAAGLLANWLRWKIKPRRALGFEYKSLRKVLERDFDPLPQDAPEMEPLRKGR